ncbi:MAG: hypothetical protein ACQSGP_28260 [Frankia sp.]
MGVGLLALLILAVAVVTLVGASKDSGQDHTTGQVASFSVQPTTSGPLTSTPIPTFTPARAVVAPPTQAAPVQPAPLVQSPRTPKASPTCHVMGGNPSASARRRYERKHGIPVCRHND